MNLTFNRTDLACEKNVNNLKHLYFKFNNNIEVLTFKNKKNYRLIKFNYLNKEIISVLINELNYFINKLKNKKSVLVVGLGNSSFTADSIGPKVLKNLNVNAHLIDMGIKTNKMKVSALEPGVLGQTGIETKKIIASIVKEVKPDFMIIIDAFVSNDINLIEKAIQITNDGIIPGSGIMGFNSKINRNTMKVPVIVIGVPTALEVTINKQKLILSTNHIDKYVLDISKLISDAINECLYFN